MKMLDSDIQSHGNTNLLRTRMAVILNSRQGKCPKGSDLWVQSTVMAVRYAIERDLTIIASIGMNTWELVLWAVGEYEGKAMILFPGNKYTEIVNNPEYFMQDFGLNLYRTAFLFIPPVKGSRSTKAWWGRRDKLAVDLAYEIIPVSIRKESRWCSALESSLNEEKTINNDFRVKCKAKSRRGSMSIEIPDVGISYDWDYVTHWTRRFPEPWPGESSKEFYTKVVHSGDTYSHRASDTLANILSEMLLRGSSLRMKMYKPAVAFSASPPHEAVKLMKWRRRYVRYTFEPYGIGIKKESALKAGITPVTYINNRKAQVFNDQTSDENTQGYSKGDWRKEMEWRYQGDLNLRDLNREDVRVVVPRSLDASSFRNLSPFKIVALDSLRNDW